MDFIISRWVDKTKVMASDCIIACRIVIVNEQLEQVDRGPTLPYIGSLITEDGQCTTEFRTGLNRGHHCRKSQHTDFNEDTTNEIFAINQCSSFDNIKLSIFYPFGLKTPI